MPREIVLAAVEAVDERLVKRVGDMQCSLPLVQRGGCLDPQRDARLIAQIKQMLEKARCSLSFDYAALWRPPKDADGVAAFPVAFEGLRSALRDVHIGVGLPPVNEGQRVTSVSQVNQSQLHL